MVRREPGHFGHGQSRWTLATLAQTCQQWLRVTTAGGLWQVLGRLGIHYKRARSYLYSPDPHYDEKVSLNALCLLRAWYEPERYVFVYLDECTYYQQPTLARAYEEEGPPQPRAHLGYHRNHWWRAVAALNAVSGQVTYRQHSKIGLSQLSDFYKNLRADYPTAQVIYVAQDNWPVHFHPDVLARLQPHDFPWPPKLPANWPREPSAKAVRDNLPIQLLCLPTYASWLNPTEKLWRWLRQDVLHLHRLRDDWAALKQRVAVFLDQFRHGSLKLLRYVGLLPD